MTQKVIRFFIGTFLILFFVNARAAKADTLVVYSNCMKKNIKTCVITPESYSNTNKIFPVVYLLHGYSGNYATWLKSFKNIKNDVDHYQFIVVCVDGNYSSWYFDSPIDTKSKYETYITTELIPYIDQKYRTKTNREFRAISGLSMGGHGALYLAFKHQDVFSVAGSMSGGVDLRPFPNNWDIAKRIGTYAAKPNNWESRSVVNLTHLLTPNSLALFIQCGTEDFFYKVNVQLHEKLAYHNIPHSFMANPGAHNWQYWSDAIKYQLLFIKANLKN